MAIITTAEFKTYRGITASTWDTLIGVLIGAAQAQAERWCGVSFDSNTYTQKYNGDGSDAIVLRVPYLTSITYIRIVAPDATYDEIDSDTYTFDADAAIIKYQPAYVARFTRDAWGEFEAPGFGVSPCFPRGFQNIEVKFVGGYSSMPSDLKMAMYQYIDELYARTSASSTGSSPTTFQSETLGDYSYTLPNGSAVLTDAGNNLVSVQWAKFRNLFQPWRRSL